MQCTFDVKITDILLEEYKNKQKLKNQKINIEYELMLCKRTKTKFWSEFEGIVCTHHTYIIVKTNVQ